jgi:hypothetical protein
VIEWIKLHKKAILIGLGVVVVVAIVLQLTVGPEYMPRPVVTE